MDDLAGRTSITRRHFIARLIVAGGGARLMAVQGGVVTAGEVSIVQFSDAGVRLGLVRVSKVVKPDSEWRKQLSELAFEVARKGATEVPFTGAYWNLHEKGLFRCVCCDTALFSSAHKFDSGTGWPSFWRTIANENVAGPARAHATSPAESEVKCVRCDAHLGDRFDDGPRPTGHRYCIDSVSLRFVKVERVSR